MSVVLRLKRKACNEPVEGLVVALKRSKFDETSNTNEVFFKFAATLKSETESVKAHIQAVLSKDRASRFSRWRDPKSLVSSQKNLPNIYEKLKRENKAASEKKKLDLLNNKRLILSETVPIEEDINTPPENAEVRKLFQLYDIIEESEDFKKQAEEAESTITCNDQLLVREKSDYVYDVYIANGQIDESFVENPISVRPCTMTEDDIYSGDSDGDGQCYEDEDDSNDENNWRNEYPEDESSDSESDQCSGDDYESEEYDPFCPPDIRNLDIDEDDYFHDSEDDQHCNKSKVLMELSDSRESD